MGPRQPNPGRSEKRRTGRLRTEPVRCDLGEVVDLSSAGLKVRGRGRRPDRADVFPLQLHAAAGTFTAPVRIVRCTRRGLFGYEIGLEFVEPDGQTREHILAMARAAMVRRWMAA